MDDTWVLNVELKLQDYATKAAKDIKAVIDPMQGQFQDLQKAVDNFSKSVSGIKLENLENLSFDKVTESISEYNKQLNEAVKLLGNTTNVAEAEKANIVIKEKVNELSEIRNKIEHEYFTQVLDWQKKYNQDLSDQKLTMEEIGKLDKQEQDQYQNIMKLEKARSAFNKAAGTEQLNTAAEMHVARSAIGTELGNVKAGSQLLSKQFSMTNLSLSQFINNIFGPYGKVLGFLSNQLDAIAGRAEKFSNALYQGAGGMNQVAQQAALMSGSVKASSDKIDEMIMSMKSAGVQNKDLMQLSETGVIMSQATGAAADSTAHFAASITAVTGSAKTAEASMMLMYRAAKEFGLAGADLNIIMNQVANDAIYMGSVGANGVQHYTQNLIAAAAAAKKLGMNTQTLTNLLEKTKDPTAYAGLFGGRAFGMNALEKQDELMKVGPKLLEQFNAIKGTAEKHRFMLKMSARMEIPADEVPKVLAGLKEMASQKEITVNLGLTTESTEKSLEDFKAAAIESTTGVMKEMESIFSKFSVIVQSILAIILPIVKPIFQIVNGLLDTIIAIIAPLAQMAMNIFSMLSPSKEIGEFFRIIVNIAQSLGKILAVIVGVYLAPFLLVLVGIVGAFKLMWGVVQPFFSMMVDVLSWLTEGIMETFGWLIDKLKEVFSYISAMMKPIVNWWKEWGGSIKETVKWIGRLVGVIALLAAAFWVLNGGFSDTIDKLTKMPKYLEVNIKLLWKKIQVWWAAKVASNDYFRHVEVNFRLMFRSVKRFGKELLGMMPSGGAVKDFFAPFIKSFTGIVPAATKAGTAIASIGTAAPAAAAGAEAIAGIGTAVAGVSTAAVGAETAVAGVGAAGAVAGAAGAAGFGAMALAALPIIAIIAAVGLLLYGIYDIIVDEFGSLSNFFKEIFAPLIWVWEVVDSVVKRVFGSWGKYFKVVLYMAFPILLIFKALIWAFKGIKGWIEGLSESTKTLLDVLMMVINPFYAIYKIAKAIWGWFGGGEKAEEKPKEAAAAATETAPKKTETKAVREAHAVLNKDYQKQEESYKKKLEFAKEKNLKGEEVDIAQKQANKFGALAKESRAEPIPTVKIVEPEAKKIRESEKEKHQKETNKKLDKLVNVVDSVTKDSSLYQLLATYLPEIASSKTVSTRANSWM